MKRTAWTKWAWTLFGYDGLLPAFVFAIPAAMFIARLPLLWIDWTGLLLPIVAYFYRMLFGLQTIEHNNCSSLLRTVQRIALFLALFPILFVDVFAILAWRIPAGGLTLRDYLTTLLFYLIYLGLMGVATYPGTTEDDQLAA